MNNNLKSYNEQVNIIDSKGYYEILFSPARFYPKNSLSWSKSRMPLLMTDHSISGRMLIIIYVIYSFNSLKVFPLDLEVAGSSKSIHT